jgi:hypothetical protein
LKLHTSTLRTAVSYAIRKASELKECYIIRYADDLKIMCRTRDEAERMFIAVKFWLKERLNLEISPEKSKITNLRKKPSEFLGFKIKAVVKGMKRVANSTIKPKAIVKIRWLLSTGNRSAQVGAAVKAENLME